MIRISRVSRGAHCPPLGPGNARGGTTPGPPLERQGLNNSLTCNTWGKPTRQRAGLGSLGGWGIG